MTWGESESVTLSPGTVILKYEEPKEYPLDCPVMSSPATRVYHPVWGLGEYLDDDKEHIFYKFNRNKVHTGGILKI